jgi:cytochrome c-type biogenesis protein CcmF
VGFAVPFAFGVAALLARRTGEVWIRTTRRWTIFAWFFLGIGVLMGAYWAYIELGWGGYWAWDPVENASFMPWLVGTAFLHSVMIQEQKRMLKVWNLVLVILTYSLAIFGTFLTRSGVLSSVHAFAGSGLGPYFAVFMSLAFFGSLGLVIWRLPDLRSEHRLDSLLSREAAFLLNNLLLIGIVCAVFFLTTFPIYSELWTGKGITMGPPIYNRVVLPWFLVLLFLVGIGPMMAWRKASAGSMRRHFLVPLLTTLGIVAVLVASGVREFYPLGFYAAAWFILATHISEFYRGTRARMVLSSESAPVALGRLVWRNRRRYGGYIVHMGIVSLVIGIVGSSAYKKDATFEDVRPGAVMKSDGYEVLYERIEMVQETKYARATLYTRLSRGGRDLGPIILEKRIYKDVKNPTTEVGIHSTFFPSSFADIRRIGEDVYITPISMDTDSGLASFSVHVLPFVNWLWLGGIIMLIGTHIAILPDRREARLMAISRAVEERAVA